MELSTPDNPDLKNNQETLPRPVVLVLLDSWGIAPYQSGNVFTDLKLKTFSSLIKNYPTAILAADNGTSETRYKNLGAGGLLSKCLETAGFSQLNLTESEKLILSWHYFNGGREKLLNREELQVISSTIGNRQELPEQALPEIVKIALRDIKKGRHDFIIINLANLDLVSSAGNLETAKSAAKILDKNLGRLVSAVLKQKGLMIVTAAYGHGEALINTATGLAESGISNNPVPFIIVSHEYQGKTIGLPETLGNDLSLLEPAGTLVDVAPTILRILNITPPKNMPGESLI